LNYKRLPALRETVDAGANVLPALSVASLVGFGAVIAVLPAFALVKELPGLSAGTRVVRGQRTGTHGPLRRALR
jgi:hypothetical protein